MDKRIQLSVFLSQIYILLSIPQISESISGLLGKLTCAMSMVGILQKSLLKNSTQIHPDWICIDSFRIITFTGLIFFLSFTDEQFRSST